MRSLNFRSRRVHNITRKHFDLILILILLIDNLAYIPLENHTSAIYDVSYIRIRVDIEAKPVQPI